MVEGQVRIAYIMQCHKNPKQVNRLFSRLSCDSADFYIHVDKKSEIQDEIEKKDNIFFVPDRDRVDVIWGDYSQCEATLRLLSCVLNSGKNYDYVWLISGQDYPIKGVCEINKFLQEANSEVFIDVIPETENGYARFRKRNEVYHLSCMLGPGFSAKIFRRLWYCITGGGAHTLKIFKRKSPFEKEYFGSSWWCIPYSYINEIYVHCQREDIQRYFVHSANPDESMFQTIYMSIARPESRVRRILTYVDWSAGGSNPKILTKDDATALLLAGNKYLMARKFDENYDEDILNIIDEAVHKSK